MEEVINPEANAEYWQNYSINKSHCQTSNI